MKKQIQKGFTLIELMIVIAIIGILAVIALPAYQDHIARTQATEAFTATSGLQTDIGVFLAQEGHFPTAAEMTTDHVGEPIANAAGELEGKYFAAGGVTVEDGNGMITVTFNAGANSDKTVTITPTLNTVGNQIARWTCDGLDPKRLPSSCRQ